MFAEEPGGVLPVPVVADIDDEDWIRETELVNGIANFPGQIEESKGCFARWILGKVLSLPLWSPGT
jgi:hypothetical protein